MKFLMEWFCQKNCQSDDTNWANVFKTKYLRFCIRIRLGKKIRLTFGSFVIEKSFDHWKDIGCPRTEGNDIKSFHIFLMILLRHIFSTIYVKGKFSFFFTIFLQLIDKICRYCKPELRYIYAIILFFLFFRYVLFDTF